MQYKNKKESPPKESKAPKPKDEEMIITGLETLMDKVAMNNLTVLDGFIKAHGDDSLRGSQEMTAWLNRELGYETLEEALLDEENWESLNKLFEEKLNG
jgi:hypothetical protein